MQSLGKIGKSPDTIRSSDVVCHSVGARLEDLLMGVLTATSNLGCNFFRILTSGLEQCALSTSLNPRVPLRIFMGGSRLLGGGSQTILPPI